MKNRRRRRLWVLVVAKTFSEERVVLKEVVASSSVRPSLAVHGERVDSDAAGDPIFERLEAAFQVADGMLRTNSKDRYVIVEDRVVGVIALGGLVRAQA